MSRALRRAEELIRKYGTTEQRADYEAAVIEAWRITSGNSPSERDRHVWEFGPQS